MRKGWNQPGVGIDVWRNVRWIDQGYELVVSRTGLSWNGRVFRDGSCWMATSSMCVTDSMIACEDFAYWKCGGCSENQPHKPTQAEIEELCKGITVEESPSDDSALRVAELTAELKRVRDWMEDWVRLSCPPKSGVGAWRRGGDVVHATTRAVDRQIAKINAILGEDK